MIRLHLAAGWLALASMTLFGLVLEALHAFKVSGYLDVENETRRLFWTLGHAHGALLGLVQLGFAFTITKLETAPPSASRALLVALLLLPLGFFLGGLGAEGGDPSAAVLFVPVGGAFLLFGTTRTVVALVTNSSTTSKGASRSPRASRAPRPPVP